MGALSGFCTCKKLTCPLHPTNHNKGCAPCISKNLKLKEIPSCFFNTIPDAQNRAGDSYKDFATLIFNNEDKQANSL